MILLTAEIEQAVRKIQDKLSKGIPLTSEELKILFIFSVLRDAS